jgi:hypothetical protein
VGGRIVSSSSNATDTLSISSYIDYTRIAAPADPSSANRGRVYVKQIDTNNDGLFIKIKKAGAYVEVQIA